MKEKRPPMIEDSADDAAFADLCEVDCDPATVRGHIDAYVGVDQEIIGAKWIVLGVKKVAEDRRKASASTKTRAARAERRRRFMRKLLALATREPTAAELARRLTAAGYPCSASTAKADLRTGPPKKAGN